MFTPIRNVKIYEQVIEQIQGMILDGKLKKGDKLPSERDLAEQLNVSRTSVREALRSLEVIGLIECRQGEGNFVKERFENNLIEPLSIIFLLEDRNPIEILELRKIIEIETAYLAAKRITDEEIKDLKDIVERLKASKDEAESAKIDKEFHYRIAKSSGNFLIVNILNILSSLMDRYILEARKIILLTGENSEYLLNQHENIYTALSDRNPDMASLYMKKHFEMIERSIENK
ncbi:transcriptional regulator, GntR family [Caloramator quimbayensis]|uniref:Transcriptional regulator, GntR family n=1 Tax=Caloramator quimbayensis TaxID=1147123 RepID=A0A1T4XU66_9CLOT|nr:FadR/GntR family transcriptional regulator [Caloramator quimbayensis]SKA93096.1 transcriptional regulator, GntR family [Caloramator quimbayensis]